MMAEIIVGAVIWMGSGAWAWYLWFRPTLRDLLQEPWPDRIVQTVALLFCLLTGLVAGPFAFSVFLGD